MNQNLMKEFEGMCPIDTPKSELRNHDLKMGLSAKQHSNRSS
jgi:hypothetical protein